MQKPVHSLGEGLQVQRLDIQVHQVAHVVALADLDHLGAGVPQRLCWVRVVQRAARRVANLVEEPVNGETGPAEAAQHQVADGPLRGLHAGHRLPEDLQANLVS